MYKFTSELSTGRIKEENIYQGAPKPQRSKVVLWYATCLYLQVARVSKWSQNFLQSTHSLVAVDIEPLKSKNHVVFIILKISPSLKIP